MLKNLTLTLWMVTCFTFFSINCLAFAGSTGGNWNVASTLDLRRIDVSNSLLGKMRNSATTFERFHENGMQFRTLSRFVTDDNREGFVLQDEDGQIHTITEPENESDK